ncbi:YfbK domain-containing protein [Sphingobacterium sp. LRF_L2]|uniref:vWA domain-containing protein n=1 Tax=Sphingobacterium sp. LRF_L2 TaxID=3369421 RepID=UPI003F633672
MKKIVWLFCMLLLGVGTTFGRQIGGAVYYRTDRTVVVGALVTNQRTASSVYTDGQGKFVIDVEKGDELLIRMVGFQSMSVKINKQEKLTILLEAEVLELDEVVVSGVGSPRVRSAKNNSVMIRGMSTIHPVVNNTESYAAVKENKFLNPLKEPLSTFAADVDAASYSNVRRMLKMGTLPPQDAVRVEEMINYFQYDLQGPQNDEPVRIFTELTRAPWNPEHQLLRISLKAKDIEKESLAASNFVFLIDVSGSMYTDNKLPLVKSSLKMLVDQLRPTDRVAIVTYAGAAGVKLESTTGDQKMKIKEAIDDLEAAGSTAGSAGIKKAYQIARTNFIKNGNNRIIMATDGDFNVGASTDEDMERLIEQERESGINISILGYGMGNYKDSKMEILADKGRGNYAYIDNISEARKAIVHEFGATLFTVAKDVKIQVEFNPAYLQAYRLVGYENRLLEAEDFNNDAKIGGDMGVGHTVTALYELIPKGINSAMVGTVDKLKYQKTNEAVNESTTTEIATVKFRYKEPQSEKSKLQQKTVSNNVVALEKVSADFRFASAVAEFGMLLRNSPFRQSSNFSSLITRAREAKGLDEEGYRMEFIRMAEDASALMETQK